MARVLVCGTLAYDDIGTFGAPLTDGTRNVKLERLERGFGGCAMNIAYNLAGLGHQPVPFVYAGDDYSGDYARHVAAAGISEAGIFRVTDMPSARGIVLTGSDGAQFTAFYPGPSGLDRWRRDLETLLGEGSFDAAVLAPDLPEKMIGCARTLDGIPFTVWCPGQYAEMLHREHLEVMSRRCRVLVANRHEWQALTSLMPEAEILDPGVDAIVTDGPGPVTLLPGGLTVEVPPVPPAEVCDPTGCGDAFVAAYTGAVLNGAAPREAVVAGVRAAGACLRRHGAQSHPVTS